eukprot:3186937-Alexandrium_andersonii.AAC.1
MSASLVGSEMCIRDSLCACLHECIHSRRPLKVKSPRSGSGSDQSDRGEAVSYTHLTLPTICSV